MTPNLRDPSGFVGTDHYCDVPELFARFLIPAKVRNQNSGFFRLIFSWHAIIFFRWLLDPLARVDHNGNPDPNPTQPNPRPVLRDPRGWISWIMSRRRQSLLNLYEEIATKNIAPHEEWPYSLMCNKIYVVGLGSNDRCPRVLPRKYARAPFETHFNDLPDNSSYLLIKFKWSLDFGMR